MKKAHDDESSSNIDDARKHLAERLALLLAKHWRRMQCEPPEATQGREPSPHADQRHDTGK